ncbi:serine hydrolase [Bacillus sp. DTU_2020_1000418_1_SI_GHA_SEK_038]|uniref:serine hydrolase n=1 Tax=Bacillus sp. DTU_2020_1000418_1_SI_GHA_SEK_038 TaxID=3077585 RepID=UPI0028EE29DF|nr:serine hydrolase [Bacillus sp. DTU_2020_1000418_1_SI_GHA_SEK_038]WNS75898.1 serine hydrolase [Bacillus sp. DTU_2020_1000418_1_SI_GHA_SEK_038]
MDIGFLKRQISELITHCDGRVGVVIETQEGRIEVNGAERFSAASLIKIPILIEGFRQSDHGVLNLEEYLPALPSNRVGGAGVLQALSEDLKLKIIDLMVLMIIVSDNTATNLLINRLGKNKIKQCMKTLNLQNTELNRKMMDFEAMKNGLDNFTSANDMVTCLKVINQHSFLSKESSEKAFGILAKQQFKNKLSNRIDLEMVKVASKTGELPGIEHDCAILKHGSKTVYAAILIDQLSEQDDGRKTLAQIGNLLSRYMIND